MVLLGEVWVQPAVVAALIAVAGVLVTALLNYLQLKKSAQAQKERHEELVTQNNELKDQTRKLAEREQAHNRLAYAEGCLARGDDFEVAIALDLLDGLRTSEWLDKDDKLQAVSAINAYTKKRTEPRLVLPGWSGGHP